MKKWKNGNNKLNMKRVLFTLMLAACSLSSCLYIDMDLKYVEGCADIYERVTDIDIDWDYGVVQVRYWDEDYVSFHEESYYGGYVGSPMCYYLRGTSLSLRNVRSGHSNESKTLTLYLPHDTFYRNIDIETVNADVDADVDCDDIDIETVDGGIVYSTINANMHSIDIDTVRGDIELKLPMGISFNCDFDTQSGSLYSEFSGLYNGDEFIYGNGRTDIDVDTVRGSLSLTINK